MVFSAVLVGRPLGVIFTVKLCIFLFGFIPHENLNKHFFYCVMGHLGHVSSQFCKNTMKDHVYFLNYIFDDLFCLNIFCKGKIISQ